MVDDQWKTGKSGENSQENSPRKRRGYVKARCIRRIGKRVRKNTRRTDRRTSKSINFRFVQTSGDLKEITHDNAFMVIN